ncbi:MAG: polysaccharide deacetylase family protein [Clostridia bacterium]|nr:polysaccharide deacetylase family protein [Clostridia bacterium]
MKHSTHAAHGANHTAHAAHTTRAAHAAGKRGRRQGRGTPAAVLVLLCALAAFGLWRLASAVRQNVDAVREYEAAYAVNGPAGQDGAPLPAMTLEPQSQQPQASEQAEAPTAAPTAVPTAAPTPTPSPTPTPTPEPTQAPEPFSYLPVILKADTEAKKIAVTVDDCYQMDNLKTIIKLANDNGARLTLFPVGENVVRSGMSDILKRAVFDLNFEIENHTWSHARIFRLPQAEMAAEIWKQNAAVSRALGVNYQEHFLRLMGGDGDTDQRIHNYLSQMNYLAIAKWSISGSDSDMAHIKSGLGPGQIYLFHTTDPDTKKLKEFIPYAVSKGYMLVTMNELFGLSENATAPLTDSAMPAPRPFAYDYRTIKREEYTWVALMMQEVLRSQGYLQMTGLSTGYYGPQTVKAVAAWQRDHGLEATGEADEATQRSILGGEVVLE